MSDEARRPGESFLAHRARLKAARRRENEAPEPPATAAATPAEAAQPAATEPPAPPLTDADMPPVETLTAESDFAQFLSEGVSDALRQAALRKLFHLPEFNLLDGLNDYDEDFTKFEKLGDVVTYHQRRMQAREAAEKAAAEREAEVARQADAPAEEEATEEAVTASAKEVVDTGEGPDPDLAEESVDDDGDLQA